jgi:hypothetical protein
VLTLIGVYNVASESVYCLMFRVWVGLAEDSDKNRLNVSFGILSGLAAIRVLHAFL